MMRPCLDRCRCICKPLLSVLCPCVPCYPKKKKKSEWAPEGDPDFLSPEIYEDLRQSQCPLPHRVFFYYDENRKLQQINTIAYGYRKYPAQKYADFWILLESGKIVKALLAEKEKKKLCIRSEQMHCVDEFISDVHINSSAETYHKLIEAFASPIHTDPCYGLIPVPACCDKRKKKWSREQKLHRSLKPRTFPDRFAFIFLFFRAVLNSYAIATFLLIAISGRKRRDHFFYLEAVISGVEAYLWFTRLIRVYYCFWSLFKRVMLTGDTVHYQTKNFSNRMEDLSSISIMKYLPSTELLSVVYKRRGEIIGEFKSDLEFAVHAIPRKCPIIIYAREIIEHVLQSFLPFLSVLALLVKVHSLSRIFELVPHEWSANQWVLYLAFVNQIASIRKIKMIEKRAIQSMAFSGRDAKLQLEEKLLIQAWWDYTLVSCAANIMHNFDWPIFDSMVFWYKLSPRKIQLLLKTHRKEGKEVVQLAKSKKGAFRLRPKMEDTIFTPIDSLYDPHAAKKRREEDDLVKGITLNVNQQSSMANLDDGKSTELVAGKRESNEKNENGLAAATAVANDESKDDDNGDPLPDKLSMKTKMGHMQGVQSVSAYNVTPDEIKFMQAHGNAGKVTKHGVKLESQTETQIKHSATSLFGPLESRVDTDESDSSSDPQ